MTRYVRLDIDENNLVKKVHDPFQQELNDFLDWLELNKFTLPNDMKISAARKLFESHKEKFSIDVLSSANKSLKNWLEFMILNQNELEKEWEQVGPLGFPEWNKGYRTALQDCLKKIEELKAT